MVKVKTELSKNRELRFQMVEPEWREFWRSACI